MPTKRALLRPKPGKRSLFPCQDRRAGIWREALGHGTYFAVENFCRIPLFRLAPDSDATGQGRQKPSRHSKHAAKGHAAGIAPASSGRSGRVHPAVFFCPRGRINKFILKRYASGGRGFAPTIPPDSGIGRKEQSDCARRARPRKGRVNPTRGNDFPWTPQLGAAALCHPFWGFQRGSPPLAAQGLCPRPEAITLLGNFTIIWFSRRMPRWFT